MLHRQNKIAKKVRGRGLLTAERDDAAPCAGALHGMTAQWRGVETEWHGSWEKMLPMQSDFARGASSVYIGCRSIYIGCR